MAFRDVTGLFFVFCADVLAGKGLDLCLQLLNHLKLLLLMYCWRKQNESNSRNTQVGDFHICIIGNEVRHTFINKPIAVTCQCLQLFKLNTIEVKS